MAFAQALTTASTFYDAVQRYLGTKAGFVQIDTTLVRTACNDALVRVAVDIGIRHVDTVVINEDQVDYDLDTVFIPDGIVSIPFEVEYHSNSGKIRYGLHRRDVEGFTVTENSGQGSLTEGLAYEWKIRGRTLSVSPPKNEDDLLVVFGPRQPRMFASDTSTTNVYSIDRYAVVYWACRVIATARQNYATAQSFQADYASHVRSRGGNVSSIPQVPVQ